MAEIVRNFDPLLRDIASVARGGATGKILAEARAKIEEVLPKLEAGNWHIAALVQRILEHIAAPSAVDGD